MKFIENKYNSIMIGKAAAFPIIIELYLFSINFIDENLLNESQMSIKKQIISNRLLFEDTRKSEYIFFVNEIYRE